MLFWHFYLCRWLGIFSLTAFNIVSLLYIFDILTIVHYRFFFAHIYLEVSMALVFEYLYFPSRFGEFSALIFVPLVLFQTLHLSHGSLDLTPWSDSRVCQWCTSVNFMLTFPHWCWNAIFYKSCSLFTKSFSSGSSWLVTLSTACVHTQDAYICMCLFIHGSPWKEFYYVAQNGLELALTFHLYPSADIAAVYHHTLKYISYTWRYQCLW